MHNLMHEAKLISIAKINEAARGIKNSQSDTAVIDWLNQAFLKNPPPLGVGSVN